VSARRRWYPPGTLAAILTLAVAAGGATLWSAGAARPESDAAIEAAMLQAATRTAEAFAVIRQERRARGLPINPVTDPNRTGLIGLEWSPMTTTLGLLHAKRTATNPNLSAGLVRWLREAGVREGSVVAIGASGSFPGLIVATLAAVQELGAEPLVVSSVAASSWGANDPAFTWPDMESALVRAGLAPKSIAASLGGEDDAGAGPEGEVREPLEAALARSGIAMIAGRTLGERVAARMDAYDRAASGRRITAFVNIGGAAGNIGTCLEILHVGPGVHRTLPACRGEPGALWRMSARGVPVVHLLHVEGIARAFGLPIDPVPLPRPGSGAPFTRPPRRASGAVLAGFAAGLIVLVRRGRAMAESPSRQVAA